ncbi:hypothetical protein XA68_13601 [Ophiocordyceps unilateralis]|uniref:Uncharacterized protein n=1 Tax=Ophiocordyceps unilateralis TaxID=268505 RepID=A0A2A9PC84_OPHUN|nr:hypothetical protein XA68_13601 [Ophiocordyceps unilateralis]
METLRQSSLSLPTLREPETTADPSTTASFFCTTIREASAPSSTAGCTEQATNPLNGPFFGGVPTSTDDGLVTFIFLLLFALGAVLHLVRLIGNNQRRHKFLLSIPLVAFCLFRTFYCIFRFAWAFLRPPFFNQAVVALAMAMEAYGSVILIPNLFISQRIICAMHPVVGWHKLFQTATWCLAMSIAPVSIIASVSSIIKIVAFRTTSAQMTKQVLEFADSWQLMVSLIPLVSIFIACAVPGQRPQNFGTGNLRLKTALLVFSSITLVIAPAVRLAVVANPQAALDGSPISGKPVFYTTALFLESLTVFSYLIFRFDNLYWIPDGSKGPGDYSQAPKDSNRSSETEWTREQIKLEVSKLGIQHEFLNSGEKNPQSPLYTLLFPSSEDENGFSENHAVGGSASAGPSTPSTFQRWTPPPQDVEKSIQRLSIDQKMITEWSHRRTSSWDSVDEAKMFAFI